MWVRAGSEHTLNLSAVSYDLAHKIRYLCCGTNQNVLFLVDQFISREPGVSD
jgi:hypothetical protein